MFDIFISYAKEDIEKAIVLRDLLKSKNYNVWWDKEFSDDEVEFRIDLSE